MQIVAVLRLCNLAALGGLLSGVLSLAGSVAFGPKALQATFRAGHKVVSNVIGRITPARRGIKVIPTGADDVQGIAFYDNAMFFDMNGSKPETSTSNPKLREKISLDRLGKPAQSALPNVSGGRLSPYRGRGSALKSGMVSSAAKGSKPTDSGMPGTAVVLSDCSVSAGCHQQRQLVVHTTDTPDISEHDSHAAIPAPKRTGASAAYGITNQVPWIMLTSEGGMMKSPLPYKRALHMQHPHPPAWRTAKATPVREWSAPRPAEVSTRQMVVWGADMPDMYVEKDISSPIPAPEDAGDVAKYGSIKQVPWILCAPDGDMVTCVVVVPLAKPALYKRHPQSPAWCMARAASVCASTWPVLREAPSRQLVPWGTGFNKTFVQTNFDDTEDKAELSKPSNPAPRLMEDQPPAGPFPLLVLWLLCYTAGYFCTPLWRQAAAWVPERPISAATTPPHGRKTTNPNAGKASGIAAVTVSVICGFFFPVLTKARLLLIAREVVSPRQVKRVVRAIRQDKFDAEIMFWLLRGLTSSKAAGLLERRQVRYAGPRSPSPPPSSTFRGSPNFSSSEQGMTSLLGAVSSNGSAGDSFCLWFSADTDTHARMITGHLVASADDPDGSTPLLHPVVTGETRGRGFRGKEFSKSLHGTWVYGRV